MPKGLIFLTERYPNEFIGSTYEQNEIINLQNDFEHFYIYSQSTNKQIDKNFIIPQNTTFKNIAFSNSKWKALLDINAKYLIKELKFAHQQLGVPMNPHTLKVAIQEFHKAETLKNQIISDLKHKITDCTIYSFWFDYRALAACLIKLEYPNVKVIIRSHGGDVYYERHPYNYLPYKKIIHEIADGIFPISKKSEIYLKKKIGVTDKIKYHHLGTYNDFKKDIDFENTQIHLVSCSHVVPIKRVFLIIDTLAQIKDINFKWSHIGGNYSEIDIQKYCQEKFTHPNQNFELLGTFNAVQINDYYENNDIDFFLNFSSSEGIPVSIMEANSYGIPAIATNAGSTDEIVINNISGYLVPIELNVQDVITILSSYQKKTKEEKVDLRNKTYLNWYNNFNAAVNYPKFRKIVLTD